MITAAARDIGILWENAALAHLRRAGLVPLIFEPALLQRLQGLAGVSVDVRVGCGKHRFEEAMLFTHRGLSGPAILQISSYWRPGEAIEIDMAPGVDVFAALVRAKAEQPRQAPVTVLAGWLPRRLAQRIGSRLTPPGRRRRVDVDAVDHGGILAGWFRHGMARLFHRATS